MVSTTLADDSLSPQVQRPQRAAIYARVSTDEQKKNESIKTQLQALDHWVTMQDLLGRPVIIVERYLDDGVSGALVPLAERPAGKRLLADAAQKRFASVLVYKLSRFGRDTQDTINCAHQLDHYGVILKSITEDFDMSSPAGRFMFNMLAATAGFQRDSQMEHALEGMERCASAGAWLGGMVPYGYYVLGQKKHARLAVSDLPLPGLELSQADVIRLMYRLLIEDKWSCERIARHLNTLGVPTAYTLLDRKVTLKRRGHSEAHATAGLWTYATVRKIIINPVYKGEHHHGKRGTSFKSVIRRPVPPIVDPATWELAQQVLRQNRRTVRPNERKYLLRGLITCAECGLAWHGSLHRAGAATYAYYTCSGKNSARNRTYSTCTNPALSADRLEAAIWADILSYLKDPRKILRQLQEHLTSRQQKATDLEKERFELVSGVSRFEEEKARMLAVYRRGRITLEEFDRQLDTIAAEEADARARLTKLDTALQGQQAVATRIVEAAELLRQLKAKSRGPWTWEKQRELVEALVLTIEVSPTPIGPNGERVLATYVFELCADKRMVRGAMSGSPTARTTPPRLALARPNSA
jgi:site-specific DNA recombinase